MTVPTFRDASFSAEELRNDHRCFSRVATAARVSAGCHEVPDARLIRGQWR